MGTTPTYGLPYPESSDEPDGGAQIKALAEAVDALVESRPFVVTARQLFSSQSSDFEQDVIQFGVTFAAPPTVVANTENSLWHVQISNVTTTQASLTMRRVDGAVVTNNVYVNLVAVGDLA